MNIKDTNSGTSVDLQGEDLELFEEELAAQVCQEIDEAESYLEDTVRPRISENWEYYRRELPKARPGEASYVDNTCQATVDHYVAACLDAFTSNDTMEAVPVGVTNPLALKAINQVINSVLDTENDRFSLYQSFFKDCFVSGASVFKPYVTEETTIDKQFFKDLPEEELAIRQMDYESNPKYDRVELIITKEEFTTTEAITPAEVAGITLGSINVETQTVTKSGYFALVSKEKTIKIEPIQAENFLINKDADSIKSSRFVGHKAMVTISELLEMGFEYDKVKQVYEKAGGSTDAEDNEASRSRKRNIIGDSNDATSVDSSQREVEVYEVYIKSSVAETLGDDDVIAVAKLYQVFMAEEVLLDYQEVDFIPYSGSSPNPVPNMFWGTGMVDATKHVQTAKSGLYRQQFAYNELASRPRFTYIREALENARDIYNTQPGAGIAVKSANAITPLQMSALTGDNVGMANLMDQQREVGTGMSFTGQGMLGDVLKAGGSTISAQMVLTEGQMVQKAVIQTLLENGIKPLIKNIYNLLKENFNEWEVSVDGQTLSIDPSMWPRLREVTINTPLGKSAKLEKAQTYMSMFTTLATAQGEAAKLVKAEALQGLLVRAYESQGISDASAYMANPQEIAQKDQLMNQMQQMSQQLQQMQEQLATMTQQNQVLQVQASNMAQKELELREREVGIKEQAAMLKAQKQEADLINMADEQDRKQGETDAKVAQMADTTLLKEKELALKELTSKQDSLATGVMVRI